MTEQTDDSTKQNNPTTVITMREDGSKPINELNSWVDPN